MSGCATLVATSALRLKRSFGIIVLDRHDRVLLLKHANGSHWSFCKGRTKRTDRSAIHTAARELLEETALRAHRLWSVDESWEEYCMRLAIDVSISGEGGIASEETSGWEQVQHRRRNKQRTVTDVDDEYINNITPANQARVFIQEYPVAGGRKRVEFFIAKVHDPGAVVLQDIEVLAYQWLPKNQVLEVLTKETTGSEDGDRSLWTRVHAVMEKCE